MSISILFADVSRCNDPKLYIRKKLHSAWSDLPESDLDQLAQNSYRQGKPVSLPLTKKEEFACLNEQQQGSVDRKIKLFLAAVERLSPLLDGETKQESDFVSYLSENFRDFAKGTPVLMRVTNYATVCYLFENVLVDESTAQVSYMVESLACLESHTGYRSPYFEQSGCKDDPRARAEQARSSYIASVRKNYRKDHQDQLPWMRDVAADWNRLIDRPLQFH